MAGRIQFVREKAVADAAKVFWRKGFNCTSLEDLKAATGLNESSLYNTFGSKKALFLEALATYFDGIIAEFSQLPIEEHPLESIRGLLQRIALQGVGHDKTMGCMLMNSALELGADHPDIAEFARKRYKRIEDWLYNAVTRAQAAGEISPSKDPRGLARFLVYSLQSMMTISRTNPTKDFMNDILDLTLSVLDSAGPQSAIKARRPAVRKPR